MPDKAPVGRTQTPGSQATSGLVNSVDTEQQSLLGKHQAPGGALSSSKTQQQSHDLGGTLHTRPSPPDAAGTTEPGKPENLQRGGNTEHGTAGGDEEKSLNWVQSFNLWLMMLFMGTQLSLPYTLSVYLVRDFSGPGTSEQAIGQLTGLLAAAQSFARSLTAFPWGILSDLIGRKVCVIVGTAASMVSLLGYGISRSYMAALLARAIPALLVGSPVALKAMIGDVCDKTGQAKAMAIFNLGHGLGTVVGPFLGGMLSYPCTRFSNFPSCHEGGLFLQRPFLLPCLAVSVIGLLALAGNILLLNETHPDVVASPGGWWGNLWRVLCCKRRAQQLQADPLEDEVDEAQLALQQSTSQRPSDLEMGKLSNERSLLRAEVNGSVHEQKDGKPSFGKRKLQTQSKTASADGYTQPGGVPDSVWADAKAEADEHDHDEDTPAGGEEQSALLRPVERQSTSLSGGQSGSQFRWWKDRNVRLALVGSGMVAFLFNYGDELSPIFVSAPVTQGGLSMPLEEFTWPISVGGATLVVFSLALYPRLIKRFGSLKLARAGLFFGVPFAMLMPLASAFGTSYAVEQVCVFLAVSIKSVAKVCALNSSMITVNLVAPKGVMGAVNGGAMTLQSGGRAFGPLLAGTVWAISVSLHVFWQQYVGFGMLVLGLIATQFIYSGLELPL